MTSVQVLPKELRLTPPPTMPQARSYLFKQQSTQASYQPGQTIQINIPRLQRSYLTKDSYLKFRTTLVFPDVFKYTVDAVDNYGIAATPCLETCGAQGLIDKIEVFDYLGSTLLESTSGYGQLLAALVDAGYGYGDAQFHGTVTEGIQGGVTAPALVPTVNGTAPTFSVPNIIHCGYPFKNHPTVDDTTYNDTIINVVEFAIPLLSFLGTLSPKFAPLHNGFTINITLNSLVNMIGYSLVEGWTGTAKTAAEAFIASAISTQSIGIALDQVNMCCQVLELGPQAEAMLLSSTQGQPLVVHTKAFRNFVGTVAEGVHNYRLDLNLNVASMTNILWFMRQQSQINDIRQRCLSHRIKNYVNKWYFQYGSSILPQTSGIQSDFPTGTNNIADQVYYENGFTEAYIEMLKSRHKWSDATKNALIHPWPYGHEHTGDTAGDLTARLAPTATETRGQFLAGLDLELVSGRSNDLVCGLNTNGMNTSIVLEMKADQSTKAARLDAYCEYDAFINVSPGIATTVSF